MALGTGCGFTTMTKGTEYMKAACEPDKTIKIKELGSLAGEASINLLRYWEKEMQ
ncbi:MAG: hypothetical protein HFI34_05720 [Lachnospiraceae bacterium]|nr:hypothetical protein [Lachnospiraceae bacterium]